ncbi:hypothetical protein FOZG_18380 [Fusarium oxysporum Fo47]|uniref:Uncharacterized protein n=1 Tax=Fusarium oxysporum Fo47 TaxID=660027 RepID=W9JDZ9_FUSOX|nr:hypothetical protein FOZG_18380 [Fusarium oxysporum Fo47]
MASLQHHMLNIRTKLAYQSHLDIEVDYMREPTVLKEFSFKRLISFVYHTIQHIIGTNGASYRTCYPSAGGPGAAEKQKPQDKPVVREVVVGLWARQLEAALEWSRPDEGRAS